MIFFVIKIKYILNQSWIWKEENNLKFAEVNVTKDTFVEVYCFKKIINFIVFKRVEYYRAIVNHELF